MKTVEIIAIGDELLRGIVAESNAHWLAKRIAARGAALTRIQVLPDDPPIVADEIRAALARAPNLLITHGGLGPTDDDRTREALSLGLDRPQELHAEAESIVRRRYAELASDGIVASAALDDARIRMAMLPQGARALDNHVGAAPGIVFEAGSTTIVALPGVPPELWWIWENPLAPILDELLGPGGFHEITEQIQWRDESAIAPLLQEVQERHPHVYVKSRAHGFGDEDLLRITVHATGESDAAARALAETAFGEVQSGLREMGIET